VSDTQPFSTQQQATYDALAQALSSLIEAHPSQKWSILRIQEKIKSRELSPSELPAEMRKINAAIIQERDRTATEMRLITADINKQIKKMRTLKNLSAPQQKALLAIDASDGQDPALMLKQMMDAMDNLASSVDSLRAKETIVVGEGSKLKKDEQNVVAGDIAWSSRVIVKSITPVLQRLQKEFSSDAALASLVSKGEDLTQQTTVDFYDAISLMEEGARKIALLQKSRMNAETDYLLSFHSHLKGMHSSLTENIRNTDVFSNASERDKDAMNKLLDAFKDVAAQEDDPKKLKRLIGDNVNTMKDGFKKIMDRQQLHIKKQQRTMDSLQAEVRQQEEQQARLIKQHHTLQGAISDMESMSLIDELTGAGNRRAYESRIKSLDTAISRSENGATCSLIVLDIDKFKSINDTHGHQVGDRALKAVTKLVKNLLEKLKAHGVDGNLYRYGGEEFVIVLPNQTVGRAANIAERIRASIARKAFSCEGKAIPVTSSFGVSGYSTLDCTGDVVFNIADECLYHAKRTGRNRVVVYHNGQKRDYPARPSADSTKPQG
jgi:diguanylate cyclase (GGDEF)-like protein